MSSPAPSYRDQGVQPPAENASVGEWYQHGYTVGWNVCVKWVMDNIQRSSDDLDTDAIWNQALDAAAAAVEDHSRKGREWVPNSLWGNLQSEAAGRIRALKIKPQTSSKCSTGNNSD